MQSLGAHLLLHVLLARVLLHDAWSERRTRTTPAAILLLVLQ
jgi:hypothetical protein